MTRAWGSPEVSCARIGKQLVSNEATYHARYVCFPWWWGGDARQGEL